MRQMIVAAGVSLAAVLAGCADWTPEQQQAFARAMGQAADRMHQQDALRQQQYQANMPRQTNCQTYGNQTRCTTW